MTNTSQSHLRILLLGLGLIVLVAGAIAIYGWLTTRPVEPVNARGTVTASQAFPAAANLAAQWRGDAGLVSASAQWLNTSAQQNGKSIEWSFQFFSPSTQQVIIVNVYDGTASHVNHLYTDSMHTFSIAEWPVDSDQAWLTWLEHGGQSMLARYPTTTLAMTLRLPSEDANHPVWQVGGVATGKKNTLIITVDATDGTVVSR